MTTAERSAFQITQEIRRLKDERDQKATTRKGTRTRISTLDSRLKWLEIRPDEDEAREIVKVKAQRERAIAKASDLTREIETLNARVETLQEEYSKIHEHEIRVAQIKREQFAARVATFVGDIEVAYKRSELRDGNEIPFIEGMRFRSGVSSVVIAYPIEGHGFGGLDVTVYLGRNASYMEQPELATVSWSTWSSSTPSEARIYAHMIRLASLVADMLDNAGIREEL